MPDLHVEIDALDAFGARLGQIATGLDSSRSAFDYYQGDLGDAGVRDAVHHFERRWRDGRRHVHDTAESLSQMVAESVKAYRQADHDLAQRLRDGVKDAAHGGGAGNQQAAAGPPPSGRVRGRAQ